MTEDGDRGQAGRQVWQARRLKCIVGSEGIYLLCVPADCLTMMPDLRCNRLTGLPPRARDRRLWNLPQPAHCFCDRSSHRWARRLSCCPSPTPSHSPGPGGTPSSSNAIRTPDRADPGDQVLMSEAFQSRQTRSLVSVPGFSARFAFFFLDQYCMQPRGMSWMDPGQ